MSQKQNVAMNQAIDLLINNDTDISTLFKEDGLYITTVNKASCREGVAVRDEQSFRI